MLRRRLFFIFTILFFLTTTGLRADILETKKDGFMDGELISDDGKEVIFKNSHGETKTFAKSEVTYFEKVDKNKEALKRVVQTVQNIPKDLQKNVAKSMQGAKAKAPNVPIKAKVAAGAKSKKSSGGSGGMMDEANKAMAQAQKAQAAQQKKMMQAIKEAEGGSGGDGGGEEKAGKYSFKKGRFSSLSEKGGD